jgi:hypothetical protein
MHYTQATYLVANNGQQVAALGVRGGCAHCG